jgi:hypothetical protein
MTTTIIVKSPSDNEIHSQNEHEHHNLLRPPSLLTRVSTFKPFPQSIIQSIEKDRIRRLPDNHPSSDFRRINQSSIDTTDEDLDENDETGTTTTTTTSSPKRSLYIGRTQRSPSDVRLPVYLDVCNEHMTTSQIHIPTLTYKNERRNSDLSFVGTKTPKQTPVDHLRRALLEHHFGRRIHSSFSSSTTIRSFNRRRSTQTFSRHFYRRPTNYLSRNSKWHFVRHHLQDIAMMNESYARMKMLERDLRWIHLRDQISKRVLDMREISILRQQDDGKLTSSQKTSFDLKTIPMNEVVHVERDGRVYSIGTRDLVLGRLISDKDIQLDTFAHLDARRKFAIKQDLLRQQEGRNRLKKHIAFSFCLCNLSFIVLMCAAMFIFAMKTIIELKSRQNF